MTTGFSISVEPRNLALHVRIQGRFDGSSAQQLLYTLKQYMDQFPVIVVDTDRISYIDVFGLNMFRYNLEGMQTTAQKFKMITFTGSQSSVIQAAINIKTDNIPEVHPC